MSMLDTKLAGSMPEPSPLAMPTQDLTRPFVDEAAPKIAELPHTYLYRIATFAPAFVTTSALIGIFLDWFAKDGLSFLESSMLVLVAFSVFWIALSVASATVGLIAGCRQRNVVAASPQDAMDVALLVPVYNEDPEAVFRRIRAMRDDLTRSETEHNFAFFVLSDTRDDEIAAEEFEHIDYFQRQHFSQIPVHYRRREKNIDRKSGNIRDWITNWGGSWDAFVVLDADSLMSADCVISLADDMTAQPDCGLLQSVPKLIGANSLFARTQQFSNNIYGSTLACGLDRWAGTEGNFWGHNAIIRIRAFAQCAGLPTLTGSGPLGGTIKSHDFVEATLLRRAGWSVRLRPDLKESYEEVPQSLIDYVLRDRRWCQGNLQHLRLIATPGMKLASRFHLFQGAMAYIASMVWFFLLLNWVLMGRGGDETVIRYFTDTNPHFPIWPEMDFANKLLILGVVLGLLLAPKLFAIGATIARNPSLTNLGGPLGFLTSCLVEIALSILLAPIMMVQHVVSITRTVLGFDAGWAPQNRGASTYSLMTCVRFHAAETIIGAGLIAGMGAGLISFWLIPIAVSLVAAVPISMLLSQTTPRVGIASKLMLTEQDFAPCRILTLAQLSNAEAPALPFGMPEARSNTAPGVDQI